MANKKQKKHLFGIDVTSESVFMQFPRPKGSTVVIIIMALLLAIVLLIAAFEDSLRSKALELVISIIEAIVTFFSASSKNK